MKWRVGPDSFRADATRFIVAGAVNTVLTIAVYQAALFIVPPATAYFIAWLAGIIFVAVAYPNLVFLGGRRGRRDRLLLALGYVGVFMIGLVVIEGTSSFLDTPRLAIVVAVTATTVANFLISRTILRRTAISRKIVNRFPC